MYRTFNRLKFASTLFTKSVVTLTLAWFGYKVYVAVLDPIEILVIGPPAGSYTDSISDVRHTYKLALERVADAGTLGMRPIKTDFIHSGPVGTDHGALLEQALADKDYDAIFGCFTSVCLAEVTDVVERHETLLFYPLPHHGYTRGEHIVYMGPVPNQVVLPALHWALENLGKRVYVVSSNTLYSRVVGEMIESELALSGGTLVGATYYGAEQTKIDELPPELSSEHVDFVVNLLVGGTGFAFFERYGVESHGTERPPNLLMTTGERELHDTAVLDAVTNSYLASNYIWSTESRANREFKDKWAQRFGDSFIAGSVEVAAYNSVILWSEATKRARSTKPERVGRALSGLSIEGAAGMVHVDWNTHHSIHTARVSHVTVDGIAVPLWQDDEHAIPVPFHVNTTGDVAASRIDRLRMEWDGNWYSSKTISRAPQGATVAER